MTDSGLTTDPMTDDERAAADAWLASGGRSLTPAPPGPNPGQPGHFAHHNWLETSVKSLAVPAPQSAYSATGVTLTAAWTLGGCDIDMINPSATQLLLVLCAFTGQATIGAGIVVAQSIQTTGATVLGSGIRGEWGYSGQTTSTTCLFQNRLIQLNPGTTKIRLGALCVSGTGQNLSYWKLTAQPVAFA